MSVILEPPTVQKPRSKPKCQAYAAWRVDKHSIWVQINDPDLARVFSKVRGARRVAYSVAGAFLETYCLNESVPWVHKWMREHRKEVAQ
jgi:hypothetical protein